MGAGPSFRAGVGDLYAERVADDVEREAEVAAGDAAVGRRVGREFRDDVPRRVQGQPPVAELLRREQAGQAGAAWCGGQEHGEVADGGVELDLGGGGLSGFTVHITQRGGLCLR